MNVRLSPSLEAMIQEKVESGDYSDASEVVEEALRFMEEQDRRTRHLKASVAEGFAQIERGESVELTPEHMERIMQRAAENARVGKSVKDDVTP
ncbi:MAG: type II toxin-antitoxin system ParD family antitoxin [Thermomicrobiales bacterium]